MQWEVFDRKRRRGVHGERGVLASDGEKVQCHLCGEWFVSLALHVRQIHDLTADEYREEFGLMRGTPLMGDGMREQRRRKLEAQVESGNLRRNPDAIANATTEQRREWSTRPKALEERKTPQFAEKQRKAAREIGKIKREQAERLEKACPICGTTFTILACVDKQTCSKPCGEENRRRLQRERLSGPGGEAVRGARTPESFKRAGEKRRKNSGRTDDS